MGIMKLFRQREPEPVEPVPEPARATMAAMPLVIGEDQDMAEYCRYRLGAIERHIDQHDTPADRMSEFKDETYTLVHALRVAKAITADEEAAALRRVGIGGSV